MVDYGKGSLNVPCLRCLCQPEYSTSDQALWGGLKRSFLVTMLSTVTRHPYKLSCSFRVKVRGQRQSPQDREDMCLYEAREVSV